MRYRIIALSHLQRQPFNKVCNERKSALSRDKIAVIIPCYNEALTIGKVIDDFRRELPEASVYVYDNNSTDGTAKIARESGAIVRHEPRQGKGNITYRWFKCFGLGNGAAGVVKELGSSPSLSLSGLQGSYINCEVTLTVNGKSKTFVPKAICNGKVSVGIYVRPRIG